MKTYIASAAQIANCRAMAERHRVVRDLRWFMAKVEKTVTCWEWKAKVDRKGYGYFQLTANGRVIKTWKAHRYSWVLHFGNIPSGLFVCHHCDNRKCVRPDHLFIGDAAANMNDMAHKGRARPYRGEDHPTTSISNATAVQIKKLLRDGISTAEISQIVQCSYQTVWSIQHGKTFAWLHLDQQTVLP